MALITRSTDASIDATTALYAPQLTGLMAGEDLDVAAPCYIKSSDGYVYMTNATADNEAAEVVGFTPRAVKSGQPVTLFGKGARFRYGTGLTPGNILYAAATAGRLDSAVTTGDQSGVAQVITSTDIRIIRDIPGLDLGTDSIADEAVTLAKMADLARGSIIVGGASDRPGAVAAKTSGQILVGDGTDLASVAVSGDATLASTGALTLGAVVTGAKATNVADANVIGGMPVLHRVNVNAAAGNTDVVLTHKTRVVDAWAVHTSAGGGVGDTLQVKNGANPITDAMDWSGADSVVVRAGNIDDSFHEIAAGGTLRATIVDGGGGVGAGVVYVLGVRVA